MCIRDSSIPGGPFTNTKGVPEEVTQAMEAKYGLDQPMPVQFVKYLGSLLHGDFGPSYKYTGKTVNDFIATGAPVSAKLGLVTLVFVLLTSIPMGILAALKNGKWQDMLLMAIATIGVTIPSFVIASMLIYVFSFKLNEMCIRDSSIPPSTRFGRFWFSCHASSSVAGRAYSRIVIIECSPFLGKIILLRSTTFILPQILL